MKNITGHIYILGDDINTDDIVPSYTLTMRDPDEIVKHVLESIDPEFIQKIDKDTIILAGHNFGSGSSREEAVNVFKLLGIKAIIANSFARIYFRNLINQGIPAISIDWRTQDFKTGDNIEISLSIRVLQLKGDVLRYYFPSSQITMFVQGESPFGCCFAIKNEHVFQRGIQRGIQY